MATQWYCKISGKASPPLSPKQLKALANQGKLGPNDLVRQGDDGPWIPAVCVKGLMPGDGSPATLPKGTPRPVAETARRGPAKHAGKPAPTKSSAVLPVAETTEGSPSKPKPAAPKRRPKPGQADPVGISAVAESATHRALGRTVTSPRKRQRNNLLAVGFLTVALIGVAVAGAVLLSQQREEDPKQGDSQSVAQTDQQGKKKPAAKKNSDLRAKPRPDRWFDASKKSRVRCGEIRVQVLSAKIGAAPDTVGDDKYLLITVQLENLNATEDRQFTRWSSLDAQTSPVTLTSAMDDVQPPPKAIQQRSSGRSPVTETLPAAGKIKEVLVFECPGDDVEKLYLTLPGKALGWRSPIGFLIPKEMFQADEPDPFAKEPEAPKDPEEPENPEPKEPDSSMPPDDDGLDEGEREFREFRKELQGDGEEGKDIEEEMRKREAEKKTPSKRGRGRRGKR